MTTGERSKENAVTGGDLLGALGRGKRDFLDISTLGMQASNQEEAVFSIIFHQEAAMPAPWCG